MLVNTYNEIIQHYYQNVRNVLNRLTDLFLKIFCLKPEIPPDEIHNTVLDLTKEVPPNLIERQGYLIRQKSLIEKHVRENGLKNQFNTGHTVEKIGDCYVKADTDEAKYNVPLVLLEKLAWNIAQILGHEAFFSPTNIVRLNSWNTTELRQGEFHVSNIIEYRPSTIASYQTDSGEVLRGNEDELTEESFDDIFSLALIYGMYDAHNNNILLKDRRPIFFDNPRILPQTNQFLYNCFGYMLPFRLELIGYKKAFEPLGEKSRVRFLNRVNETLSRLDKLKAYFNDPIIQVQFEDLPINWFDPDKSIRALEERLTIMKQVLDSSGDISYNDLVYAVYPKIKLYAALVFQRMLKSYPSVNCERALAEIGYMSLSDCFKEDERIPLVKIAQFHPDDSLEEIYKKAKSGPYVEYSRESLNSDFSKEELKAPIAKDHPKYKLFAAIIFQHKFKKSPNYTYDQIIRYLGSINLSECFKIVNPVQKVAIAQFDSTDTFEDIFRKTKEGPLREYYRDSSVKDLIDKSEVNAIEAYSPVSLIGAHLARLFDSKDPLNAAGFYSVKGVDYWVNQNLIPGEFVIYYKGARLPPMPLDAFKKWLSDGIMPKAQADVIAIIDSLGVDIIHFVYRNDQFTLLHQIGKGETKYIQRLYGKKFVIKRVHRDMTGKIKIEPLDKLKPIVKTEPLPEPKKIEHKDATEITSSSVPGYYIAEIDEVYLPPMTEEELMLWFESDKREYHRLKKYKDNHAIAVHEKLFKDFDELINVYGYKNLVQIIDTNPVQHYFYERVNNELLTYPVIERGDSVGYKKEGRWVELFRKAE